MIVFNGDPIQHLLPMRCEHLSVLSRQSWNQSVAASGNWYTEAGFRMALHRSITAALQGRTLLNLLTHWECRHGVKDMDSVRVVLHEAISRSPIMDRIAATVRPVLQAGCSTVLGLTQ